ncbi:kanadaptin [Bombus bifarius]|uniref:Kanadaptin n=1 Tax=Bombus bifarius TaxID=103933 RepID=A0A6P8NG37_9HYME|nr:kanadaptin [Bombus vancouverensis nearcticus]XP_033204740.1 kanadaptin [Bombus vancouverensis nearcticus]XP_033313440.1 kanadaptin [Bombus bifarius]XP_033313441.1 kanadaptin [Bombus bifarius]
METTSHNLMPNIHFNNDESNIQVEVNNEEILPTTNISNSSDTSENSIELAASTKEYSTNDLSKGLNDVDNIATFKKPTVLIGPKRSCPTYKSSKSSERDIKSQKHSQDQPFPYVEPSWGGKPEGNYMMEVLKSGMIIETISLNEQNFYLVGRLPLCHLSLVHPTISRYHAVLQYRSEQNKENDKGFYVYDLGSTHGTFWNGNRIKPNVYVRIQGGHMLRFGCSQRKYILQAPPGDQEEESPYSLTELKGMRASQLEKQCMEDKGKASIEEKESEGIDWGMGEDADEETDLQENPYASITDDDLVLEDPKKTLRGWFEREGYDLHYQTEEKGFGQFLCWVDLPTEDIVGHSTRAEALVKGKKKEAVVQCALEACKILDKYGLLRQANHEARKRKTRNWEAEDYYDSDEDNFLDRTGSIERKREQRMRLAGKLEEKAETYDSLLEKHKQVTKRISQLSTSIENWQSASSAKNDTTEEDALDAFMSSLSSFALTKSDIAKMKLELQNLRKEEASLIKLLNLTQPANLPALSYHDTMDQNISQAKAVAHLMQNAPVERKKIYNSLLCGKKVKQTKQYVTTNTELLESNANSDTNTAAAVEEVDSDDDDESISNPSHDSLCKENFKLQLSNTTIKNESSEKHEEQQKHNIQMTKKHRREQRKMYCDQDIHADNYSMWIPPSDQAGDGKTSLNEKYGY